MLLQISFDSISGRLVNFAFSGLALDILTLWQRKCLFVLGLVHEKLVHDLQ